MKLSEAAKKYVFTTKITIDEETGDFIELREPTQAEIVNLSGDSTKTLEQMEKLFPKCIIDSSFIDDAGNKASGEEIYKTFSASGSMLTEILSIWLEAIPFQSRLKKAEK